MHIDEWLQAVPAGWIYVTVALVIGFESLGIPLPGEIVLVSSAILSAKGVVDPVWVGVCASTGAIVGDSAGYAIGRKGGAALFERLGRRFPEHFGPRHVGKAESYFQRFGVWAVFVGRFIALLRILAGPLAGALRMPYWKFAVANVLGGIVWAGGTTAVIFYLGLVAEKWLKGFSWVGLVVAVLFGIGTTLYLKRRAASALDEGDLQGVVRGPVDV
ncbi:membrane protein DedA, SNARE-associated domain [Nonomuraea solani]|uniref:Membrane protein DedA, SNARE-associated domain n=1 Tax=Nonomuraea solani TaxID=1144553 RepID=A0A1H6EVG2_9ACTN|nr:DedA family protein [Nonomuraea solani]SEH01877.1 membrane protein DedA, SNARE-associated domain [Nonomuraea solani]